MPKSQPARVPDRRPPAGAQRWRVRDLEFDERRLEVRIGPELVRMEPKPMGVLAALLRHADRVVTTAELRGLVWDGRDVTEQVIVQAVARLRRCLGPGHADLVRTVHGWGYRLAEPAESGATGSAPPGAVNAFAPGCIHPGKSAWTLIAPLPGRVPDTWLTRNDQTGARRYLVRLRDAADIERAALEVASLHPLPGPGALRLHRAVDWNVNPSREPCWIEYPTDLRSLPDWFEQDGGLARAPLEQRLSTLATLCERVHGLHERGIFLGGLNPAAVLLCNGGLRDAGCFLPAAIYGQRAVCPHLYASAWTGPEALYHAPELRRGLGPDARADVHSLGVMLFQLVAADWTLIPLPGWEARVAHPGLQLAIREATRLDPAQRLGDARQLASLLRSCTGGSAQDTAAKTGAPASS